MLWFRRALAEFKNDTSGAVIIWFTLVMLVLVGFVGLAIDGARYVNLNSNLQEIADGAALAGAKELDGSADAIDRATDKALNYLANNPEWSDIASAGVQIASDETYGPKFYQTLGGQPTTDPKKAAYIKVTTVNREVSTTYSVIFLNQLKAGTRATATARSSFSVCAPLQSFMCNPWESEQTVKGSALNWLTKVSPGQMLMLVGGTKGAPGNWGLIDPGFRNGNPKNQSTFWSDAAPDNCPTVDVATVSQQVDTGNNAKFATPGMNVRFDNPDNQLYSAASPIVIDGLAPNTNNQNSGTCANTEVVTPPGFQQTNLDGGAAYTSVCTQTAQGSCPLPRDRTLTNLGGNSWSTSLIGDGADINDLRAYWNNHHIIAMPRFRDPDTNQLVDVSTRWQIYQMENDTTNYPEAVFDSSLRSNQLEPQAPFCRDSKPPADIRRRIINVAIVDCDYWSINGASNTLPVTTLMAEFFMTEPATVDGEIYAELIKTYQVNGNGSSIYQLVQLVK